MSGRGRDGKRSRSGRSRFERGVRSLIRFVLHHTKKEQKKGVITDTRTKKATGKRKTAGGSALFLRETEFVLESLENSLDTQASLTKRQ